MSDPNTTGQPPRDLAPMDTALTEAEYTLQTLGILAKFKHLFEPGQAPMLTNGDEAFVRVTEDPDKY